MNYKMAVRIRFLGFIKQKNTFIKIIMTHGFTFIHH